MLNRPRKPAPPPDPAARGKRPSLMLAVAAALAGAASLFSFEPFGWWPLQFLSLAFLFYQIGVGSSVKRATLVSQYMPATDQPKKRRRCIPTVPATTGTSALIPGTNRAMNTARPPPRP